MPGVKTLARRHYVQRQLLARRALLAVRQQWARMDPARIRLSWQSGIGSAVFTIVSGAQYEAAAVADTSTSQMLAAQGVDATAVATVAPSAFAGIASDGRDLASLLDLAVWQSLGALRTVTRPEDALKVGGQFLELATGLQVVDAGRVADGVAIAARPAVTGWVRMLNPPSCDRCIVLAGKFYRWNDGFERHPRCDCRHIPASEDTANDLRTDPKAYFDSLSPAEQDKTFGKAAAQAIRDGADVSQVVNARQGMRTASIGGHNVLSTTVGASRFGGVRLMPEQIYRIAGGDREEAIRLLAGNGYLVRGVQHDAALAVTH
jgi:hypothetical protein